MRKIFLRLIVPLLLLLLFFPYLASEWYHFLAPQKPLNDADILLVEGWISEGSLKQTVREFHSKNYQYLAVASIQLPETYRLHSPGALVFPLKVPARVREQTDSVEVTAYSTPAGGAFARMHVYINQQEIGSQTTHASPDVYRFPIPKNSIRQVAVVYKDDYYDWEAGEDRNLYITSVQISGQLLSPRTDSSYLDRGHLDGQKIQAIHQSEAGMSAELLKGMGVAEDKIILIEAPEEEINKTLTTARSVSQWLANQEVPYSLNIFTESTHARRSLMLYRKALAENTRVGVIASSPESYHAQNWWKDPAGRSYVLSQSLKYGYALLTYFFV